MTPGLQIYRVAGGPSWPPPAAGPQLQVLSPPLLMVKGMPSSGLLAGLTSALLNCRETRLYEDTF